MKNCQFRVSHRYSIFTICKFSWTSTRFTFPINAVLVLDIYVYNYQYLNIHPQNIWQITCKANTSTRPKFSCMFTNFPMTGSPTVSKAHVVQNVWYTQLFKTKRAGCFFSINCQLLELFSTRLLGSHGWLFLSKRWSMIQHGCHRKMSLRSDPQGQSPISLIPFRWKSVTFTTNCCIRQQTRTWRIHLEHTGLRGCFRVHTVNLLQ